MKKLKEEDLSILDKYFFRMFEFILVPGFWMSTRSFFTGLITLVVLYMFYQINNYIVGSLSKNGVVVYFFTALALIVILVIMTVSKLSKFKANN